MNCGGKHVIFEVGLNGDSSGIKEVANFILNNLRGSNWNLEKSYPSGTSELKRFKGEIMGNRVAIIFSDDPEALAVSLKEFSEEIIFVTARPSPRSNGISYSHILVIDKIFQEKRAGEIIWSKLIRFFRELGRCSAWEWD